MTAFTLRVFHPSIDPRQITEELGLPPTGSWRTGGARAESYWQTQLAGNETGRDDVESGLRDIAARFEHYRFFVEAIRVDGGRVEIAVTSAASAVDPRLKETFRALDIALCFGEDA